AAVVTDPPRLWRLRSWTTSPFATPTRNRSVGSKPQTISSPPSHASATAPWPSITKPYRNFGNRTLAYRAISRELHATMETAAKIQSLYRERVRLGMDSEHEPSHAGMEAITQIDLLVDDVEAPQQILRPVVGEKRLLGDRS